MLLAIFERGTENLRHLIVHQHRQANAETFTQLRRQSEESSEGRLRRIAVARVENLADHRLFVSHKGVAGMSGLAPEGAIVGDHHLGLRRHPRLGAAHGVARYLVEFRLKADLLFQQPRRDCEHDMSCLELDGVVAGGKYESDMVAAIADICQNMAEMQKPRRQIGGHCIDELRHTALETAGAFMKLFPDDALRRFVGIVQMEHGTIVMLRNVSKFQFGDQALYQGLRVRPEPGGTEVQRQA